MRCSHCLLCKKAIVENIDHFLLDCAALRPCRNKLLNGLRIVLRAQGLPGAVLLRAFQTSRAQRMAMLLGAGPRVLRKAGLVDAEENAGQWARACWQVNRMCKNYLVACWRVRESVMGVISIAGGVLCRDPPTDRARRAMAGQLRSWTDDEEAMPEKCRRLWEKWLPSPTRKPGWRRTGRRGPANFYVVYRGRNTGVFYQWSDCMRSIANFEDACFQGFASLQEARMAARRIRGSAVPSGDDTVTTTVDTPADFGMGGQME